MQSEQFSNLDCLAHIAGRRGIELSADALRRRYAHLKEIPSEMLVSVAADVGLAAEVMDLSWRDLPRLRRSLPAILALRDGSYVVLDSFAEEADTGWMATLIAPGDAGDSKVIVDQDQLRAVWDGELIMLKRRYRMDDENRPFSFGWLGAEVLRERQLFRDIAIASIFNTIFVLAPPFIVITIADRVLANHSVSTLWVVAAVIGFLIIFEMVLTFLRQLFMQVAATRIDGRLNLYMMDRLVRLPMDYFERMPTGHTLSRLNRIYEIRSFFTGPLFSTAVEMVALVGLIPALILLQWQLSLFVFACAAMIFVVVYVYLAPIVRRHHAVVRAEREKHGYLTETIYGMRAIKSLSLEDRRRGEWDVKVADSALARYRLGALQNHPTTYTIPFQRAMYSGSIVLGAAIVLNGGMATTAGSLIAFGMLAGRVGSPLVSAARLIADLGEARGAIHQVAEVMNVPPEDLRRGTGLRLPVRGQITFDNVDFRYSPGAPLALSGCNFEIRAGTIFGIMGRSGSGKTTITRLLQGLSPAYEGMIKIDGMDLREMDIQHLRTNIGVVPQENFLFSGTVRENIGMPRPDAPFAQIVRAAQLAGAEEFIERMPRGYDTRLEEGASNLSGGQRQRIALARALLIDPPVLILDEATSALDAESEAIINANLMRIASERTIICVSHRLSMLVPSNAILVMERGKVYDIGRHEELLHRCDIYKQMWYQQNRHLDPNANHAPYAIASSAH